MKQSRAISLLKSLISTGVGFVVAFIANALVLPLFGFHPSVGQNLTIVCIFTVISIARGYFLDRLFEVVGWRMRISPFATAVLAERQRQITHEGYDAEHDAGHSPRELAQAGAAYFLGNRRFEHTDYEDPEEPTVPISGRLLWPWSADSFKPGALRRDLVRGAALGLAAGDLSDQLDKRARRSRG